MHTSSQIYYIACFVFLFFSLIEFYTKNEKLRKATFITATIFFILFWAPRGYLFSDWKNYEPLLNQVSSCPWTRLTTIGSYEPGFLVLLKITWISCCMISDTGVQLQQNPPSWQVPPICSAFPELIQFLH